MKILHSLLSDDGKLMKSSTLDKMFQAHLSEVSRYSSMEVQKDPDLNNQLGGVPLGTKKDWCLAELLVMEDLDGQARKGSITWGGLPDLTWVSWFS